ncbi:toprim domain-containing protein [Paraclostridium sordellii]|uniref:toprim domain-containing protein n=1 Tax=Paraclostridium sordellii TaxID=1505 RepID=UPI0022E93E5F|nr:toprim domain-containing protein [Paeniclostridium sordellii]
MSEIINATQFQADEVYKLSFREQAREKIDMFFGDKSNFMHPLMEAINNANDEMLNNFPSGELIVELENNLQTIVVKDTGRGIPIFNENQAELLLQTLFAGGKYSVGDPTTGTFGCGLTATNYNCELFECTSYLNGKIMYIKYTNGGIIETPLTCLGETTEHGTIIRFKLDKSSFDNTTYDQEVIKLVLRRFSQFSDRINYKFIYNGEITEYNYTDEQYFDTYAEDIIGAPLYGTLKNYKRMTEVEIKGNKEVVEETLDITSIIGVTTNENPLQETMLNGNYLKENGTIYDGILEGIKFEVNKYCKEKKLYKKNEKDVTTNDVALAVAFTCKVLNNLPSFGNQTKFYTKKEYYKTIARDYIKEQLEIYRKENESDFKRLVEQVLICKRANDVNVKARKELKKKLTEEITCQNKPVGLYDCSNKVGKGKRRLFLNEGDSAGHALLQARDHHTDAIYSLTGKILNCHKANPYTIFKNDIIVNIYRILGCGVEMKTKDNKEFAPFDMDNLRYDEIIIATDADVDGYDIRTLLTCMIWVISPSLIYKKKLWVVEAPLYEIETNEKTYYVIDDKERDNVIKSLGNQKYEIERNKGLGQMNSDACSETIMRHDYEGLYCITPTDAKRMTEVFDLLMGEDVMPRKDYIIENFVKYENVI